MMKQDFELTPQELLLSHHSPHTTLCKSLGANFIKRCGYCHVQHTNAGLSVPWCLAPAALCQAVRLCNHYLRRDISQKKTA